MTDLAKAEPGQMRLNDQALRPAPTNMAAQLMEVIAANPTTGPENLKALLDSMERVAKWQAEREFTAAFARLKFPSFAKTAKGHNAKYAPLENIQEIIEPILAREGFTLTYSSGESNAKGEIPTYGLLSHVGGHSRPGVMWLPPDVTQTKSGGTTMNAPQSVGSSTSYGMRYCAKLMLNLRFVNEDDDANNIGFIDEKQVNRILDLIVAAELSSVRETNFLEKFMGVKSVSEIRQRDFARAIAALETEQRKVRK